MVHYVGLDVSLKKTFDLCGGPGGISRARGRKRVGFETGPTATWLWSLAHQERIIQAAPLHVLKERGHRLGIFFGARHHVQQHTTALNFIGFVGLLGSFAGLNLFSIIINFRVLHCVAKARMARILWSKNAP